MIPRPISSFTDNITINLNNNRIEEDSHGIYSDMKVVGWFYSFVKMCEETLNLSIQKGPGTSLGIVQDKVGFLQYQFDTDWNNTILYPECPQPISPWANLPAWNDSEDSYINDYGIDFENYRFDTIIWFNQLNESSPIGIRFKYPVITGRDIMTPFWYYTMPVFMPWQDTSFNGETKIIPLSNLNQISSSQWSGLWGQRNFSYAETASPINYRIQGYSTQEETGYYSLGKRFYSLGQQQIKFSENYYTNQVIWNRNFNTEEITLPTKINIDTNLNQDIVILRMFKDGNNMLSLIYGDFEPNEHKMISSYCIVNTLSGSSLLGDYVASYNKVWEYPEQAVARRVQPGVDTRISRVVLPNFYNNESTMMPTASLFQVFSFGTSMTKEEKYTKVFLDNNNATRTFKLINFGNVNNNKYDNSALIAIEKAGY